MIILGSTGSIGVNALIVAKLNNIQIEALVAGTNIELLNSQIKECNPKFVSVKNRDDISKVIKGSHKIYYGIEGIFEILNQSNSKIVINAIVGFDGLKPTIESLKLDKKLALANKESLVVGGKFLDISKITPIDSEHFGLYYLNRQKNAKKMIITASGGAFRDWDIDKIYNAKLEDALKHPNWKMGYKITIDSASMMNKLFELIEARWLFGSFIEYDAIIETKSLIHAFVQFGDGVTTAQISNADMKLPISYAVLDKVNYEAVASVDIFSIGSFEFKKIDANRYPLWILKSELLKNLDMGVVVNSANEAAIKLFCENKIPFGKISDIVIESSHRYRDIKISSLDDVFETDKEVREYINQMEYNK